LALETIGAARRGYFIEGLGGAQFALPGAVERLRVPDTEEARAIVLATADPAQLYGAGLAWPEGAGAAHSPARRAGGYVVLVDGLPIVSVEAGGHSLRVHADRDSTAVAHALGALAAAVREGQVPRLAIAKIDGEPAIASPRERSLLDLGFRRGPRRLTLNRGDA
jgi:ATP-dependent Lhr-like helicase